MTHPYHTLFFQVVCGSGDVLAYTGAIARAFPVYNQKSGAGEAVTQTVQVQFLLVGQDHTSSSSCLTPDQLDCVNALCEGVRLAQEIVDTPTNIMHTDGFLEVKNFVWACEWGECIVVAGVWRVCVCACV